MRAALLGLLAACAAGTGPGKGSDPGTGSTSGPADGPAAHVVGVGTAGSDGAWDFAVAIRSDETGCDRYADWWEVVTPEGELVFRRILNHSHPEEQPFTRSGGPVPVGAEEQVVVRAHLHPAGFVGRTMVGTALGGFTERAADPGFAAELADSQPLPTECWF